MAVGAFLPPYRWQVFYNGDPAPGAKLITALSGTDTPQPVYTDAGLTVPHANPVVADANGVLPVMYLSAVAYRMTVTTSTGTVIFPAQDNIYDFAETQFSASGGSALIGFIQAGSGAVARTAQAKMREWISVGDFGTLDQALLRDPATIYFPAGTTTTVSTNTTIPATVELLFAEGAKLSINTGVTVAVNGHWTAGRWQTISGLGTVTFGSGSVDAVYPEWWLPNTTPGTTDMTAAFTAAVATGFPISLGKTTYATDGNHVLTTQRVFGVSKIGTVVQRRGSSIYPLFWIQQDGQVDTLTLDGHSLGGPLLTISPATSGRYPALAQNLDLKNAGAAVVRKNITNITTPTNTTFEFTCASHGYPVGAMVRVKNVTGMEATANPSKSITSALFILTAVTTNTFTVSIPTTDTTAWNPYSSGGTVELASCALRVDASAGFRVFEATCRDIEFHTNYGHIYCDGAENVTFDRMAMYDATDGYSIYINNGDTRMLRFQSCYMETGVGAAYWGIRDISFDNCKVYLDASNPNWLMMIGQNHDDGESAGEIANITATQMTIRRSVADNTNGLFDVASDGLILDRVHITDTVSTGWNVLRLRDSDRIRLNNLTVESTNAWVLFSSSSTGASHVMADGIWYTQGVTGTCIWPNNKITTKNTGQTIVMNSNCNHSIRSAATARGFTFINIAGTLDLTNATAGGTFILNVTGTITDPTKTTITIPGNDIGWSTVTYGTYADNATAIGAGLVAGNVYKTATGVVMVVY